MSTKKQSNHGRIIRYSQAFKQKVISEIESGQLTKQEAKIKYGIRGSSTIQSWIRLLGKNHLLCKVVRIENIMEVNQVKLLKERILALEKALAQTQLECLQSEAYLQQACQELGVTVDGFKKKAPTEPSNSDGVDKSNPS